MACLRCGSRARGRAWARVLVPRTLRVMRRARRLIASCRAAVKSRWPELHVADDVLVLVCDEDVLWCCPVVERGVPGGQSSTGDTSDDQVAWSIRARAGPSSSTLVRTVAR